VTPSKSKKPAGARPLLIAMVALVTAALSLVALAFWLAGQLSSVLVGNGWPSSSPADLGSISAGWLDNLADPAAAWPGAAGVGPAWLVYLLFAAFLGPIAFAVILTVRLWLNWRRHREFRRFRLGFASGLEISKTLSAATVVRKASSVRPAMKRRRGVRPRDVGFYLGRDIRSRQKMYASVEDVFIVLAPPRQGKDVHFCTPYTIDAPGACIVTSTRVDAFTNTYASRAKTGNVYVFDPSGMTNWPERLRWSPILGCDKPRTAASRASALVTAAGFQMAGELVYWVGAAITILRCYLHAAALGGKTMQDVLRWTIQPTNPEPIVLLRGNEELGKAAKGWAGALEACVAAEPRARGAMWGVLVQALTCFADPAVVEACSPEAGEVFDMRAFLSGRNTLYVLGKEEKHASVAPLVTAMMESIFEETRKIASTMANSRLEPPLTVELNEVAHIAPMPNLPAYMGDSGGFSIALHIYLQSMSQARAKWGEHEAMIMWDNAAVRVIMGGAGSIDDLEDISRLMGETRHTKHDENRRVLSAEEIRTLPFGQAVVVARATRPVEVRLTPWWKRRDAAEISAGKARTAKLIEQYTEGIPGKSGTTTADDVEFDVDFNVSAGLDAAILGLPPADALPGHYPVLAAPPTAWQPAALGEAGGQRPDLTPLAAALAIPDHAPRSIGPAISRPPRSIGPAIAEEFRSILPAIPPERHPAVPADPEGSGSDDAGLTEDDATQEPAIPMGSARLLAALALTAVVARRRGQHQRHRPGHRPANPRAGRIETDLRVAGQPLGVDRLDAALRGLSARLADRTGPLPDPVGAVVDHSGVRLLLTAMCPDPPSPWMDGGDRWILPAGAADEVVDGAIAPLPTLTVVGSAGTTHVLVDLERIGILLLAGDLEQRSDLLRYVASELALNAWSDDLEVVLAGFSPREEELLVALNPDRVRVSRSVSDAVARATRRVAAATSTLRHAGVGDALAGRVRDLAADTWMPQVILVAEPDEDAMAQLRELAGHLEASGRCAIGLVVATGGPTAASDRWCLAAAPDGTLRLPLPGPAVRAAGLSLSELGRLAEIMRVVHDESQTPMPPASEVEGWAEGTDAAGSIIGLFQDGSPVAGPALDPITTDGADPRAVTAASGQRRRQTDPQLDADLRAWWDRDPARPRIGILGPATVEASGLPPKERQRLPAEIIVYLAQRGARGAGRDQLDKALWPGRTDKDASRRVAITQARRWLGETPDGEPWLPDMGADQRYRLRDGYLMDWQLFRRLRARGEARGSAGTEDLRAALELVGGVPLEGADRPYAAGVGNPYTWLAESDIHPELITAAIVDTAHQLSALLDETGDLAGVRWAVEQAWLADPLRTYDQPWRDLLAAQHRGRQTAALGVTLTTLMRTRDAEDLEDLDPVTYSAVQRLVPGVVRSTSGL
jgi:hypothetical protein